MKTINLPFEKLMNRTIEYLALTLQTKGHNEKPVLLHSIRVGFQLYELGYDEEIVLAGFLHDILEDTTLLKSDLQDQFGIKITQIIYANSFNPDIDDKTEQFKEMFARCVEYGEAALIIKAADILDNSHYIQFANMNENRAWLLFKMKYFIDISREFIGTEEIWIYLNEQYNVLRMELEKR